MRLTVVLMLGLVLLLVVVGRHLWRSLPSSTRLQLNVHAALIMLGVVLQAHLLTDLLHAWLDLLDVVRTVVAFTHNHMQVSLARLLRVSDPLLDYFFGLLHILAVQIDSVAVDFANRVVLTEDVLGGLLVVRVGLGGMLLGLLAHAMRLGTVARVVCLACFGSKVLMLALLFTREVTQAIVLLLGGGVSVVGGWKRSLA